jgi:hypothetical protein
MFTERLPDFVAAYARNTSRVVTALRAIAIVRERRGSDLEAWITAATDSGIGALARFARGLQEDLAAVTAGLTLPWSNGPVEGQITRLKLLKRQGYGRAGSALLRQRVWQAAEMPREPGDHAEAPRAPAHRGVGWPVAWAAHSWRGEHLSLPRGHRPCSPKVTLTQEIMASFGPCAISPGSTARRLPVRTESRSSL